MIKKNKKIKKELRLQYLELLTTLSEKQKSKYSDIITSKLIDLINKIKIQKTKDVGTKSKNKVNKVNIFAFYPKLDINEVNIAPFLEKISLEKDTNVFLPSIDCDNLSNKILKFIPWNLNTKMIVGKFGVYEPYYDNNLMKENNEDDNNVTENNNALPDIVIIPLIVFDFLCNRLGRGAGYYDHTLKNILCMNNNCIFVGCAFNLQRYNKTLPLEKHDISMNYIITESITLNRNEIIID